MTRDSGSEKQKGILTILVADSLFCYHLLLFTTYIIEPDILHDKIVIILLSYIEIPEATRYVHRPLHSILDTRKVPLRKLCSEV